MPTLSVHLTEEAAGAEIVREITTAANSARDVDTAVFSDLQDNYTVSVGQNGMVTVAHWTARARTAPTSCSTSSSCSFPMPRSWWRTWAADVSISRTSTRQLLVFAEH